MRRHTQFLSFALALTAPALTPLLSGCTTATTRPAAPMPSAAPVWRWSVDPAVADSVSTEHLAPGVRLYRLVNLSVPWRAVVLDLDLTGCVSLRALKGSATAVGRQTTSALLAGIPPGEGPVAAVNADFFLFAPPGVLTGAHVEGGELFTGPGERPAFAVDSGGRPFIGVLRAGGTLRSPRGSWRVASWNRPGANGLGVVDARWGQPLDSTAGQPRWRLIPIPGGARRYVTSPATDGGQAPGDTLLLAGTDAAANARLIAGDTLTLSLSLSPIGPREAVGGFPMLLIDSAPPAGPVNQGSESFRGPNPRTAVGIGANGERLLLVVIDGRQPGVSAGGTIDQTASLLRSLGAVHALNLDGGGSSAMVLAAGVGRRPSAAAAGPSLVNRPSDPTGERAVGNALAVLSTCASGARQPD